MKPGFLLADHSYEQSYPHTRSGIAEQGTRYTQQNRLQAVDLAIQQQRQ